MDNLQAEILTPTILMLLAQAASAIELSLYEEAGEALDSVMPYIADLPDTYRHSGFLRLKYNEAHASLILGRL